MVPKLPKSSKQFAQWAAIVPFNNLPPGPAFW
jgi:hypothetical protein